MRATKLLIALALFGVTKFSSAQNSPGKPVELTSTDGKTMTALILGASGSSVVLQRADRRKFTVAMSRFDIDSQLAIAAGIFSAYEVIAMPEITSRYFRPRDEEQEELPGNVYLMTAHSGNKWWPILHVGDFSNEPFSFRSVHFQNKEGASVEFPVPLNAKFGDTISGGKRWRAVQFAVDEGKLKELGEIAADPKDVTAHGITAEGKRIEIPAQRLTHLGSSVSVHLRIVAQVGNPGFLANLPTPDPIEATFIDTSRKSATIPRLTDGTPAGGPIRRFTVDGHVEIDGGGGEAGLIPLSQFRAEDAAELMSQLLESRYRFSQDPTTNMEYFYPNYWDDSRQHRMVPNLLLGRVIGSWRPNAWLSVPLTEPSSASLDRIRVFVDDEPGFALTDVSLLATYSPPEGKDNEIYHTTSFHAGRIMAGSQFETVRNARRIRFELVKDTQVFVVDAKPEQVAQIRETAIHYRILQELERAGSKTRPLL